MRCASQFFMPAVAAMASAFFCSTDTWADDKTVSGALKAVETYMFLLPAVDCYRDTALHFTTNSNSLERLLATATDELADKDVNAMKAAAMRGARRHDGMVSSKGREAYCKLAVHRYGPRGTLHKGLIIEKRP